MKYLFRPSAEKQFLKLDRQVQKHIVKKLEYFSTSPDPLSFAERLTNFESGQFRFRIGDYRVAFDVDQQAIIILAVGNRREIYK